MSTKVVKTHGADQDFDERKVHTSIYRTLVSVGTAEPDADAISKLVTKYVVLWAEKKQHISSHDIRLHGAHHLMEHSPHAAQIYLHHRNMM